MARARSLYRFWSSVILTAMAMALCLILVSSYLAGPLIRAALGAVVWPVFYALTASVALLLTLGAVLFLAPPRSGRRR